MSWSLRLMRPTIAMAHRCSEEAHVGLGRLAPTENWSAASLGGGRGLVSRDDLDGGPGSRPTLSI
jgi:hypothetical protein